MSEQMERARRLQAYEETHPRRLFQDYRRIWWYPPLPRGARVFEIGYGQGHFLRAGERRGWEMSGIDAGHEPPPGVRAYREMVEDHAWPRMPYYDAICAWQVIEHLDDPISVLQAAREALRPGGYLVLSTPNTRCVERWLWGRHWDGWRLHEPDPLERHRWHFHPRLMRLMLQASGYRVERILFQRLAKQLPGDLVTGTILAALGLSSRMTVVARVA